MSANQKANKSSTEKFHQKANRDRMRDILKNPTIFSQDDKINTLFIKNSNLRRLVGLDNETRRIYLNASYKKLRAKIPLLQMKTEMSDFLIKSPDALPEDIKNRMLQKLLSDDDDDKRLQGVKREKRSALAKLQRLRVDISQYHDSYQYSKFVNHLPTQATMDQYMMLEKEVTRTSDKMVQLLEDVHPYLCI
ncbi:hypothetical protein C5167_000714 [Papaver somniferum]|uniref:Uncharacterized protein n=1 Tax=Papaver somniferum TaxID=3469 RepID=A0A4Y7KWY2_PAPSO|nr:hypothetical protein C5167_000714 [Papaver somniferum]